MSMNPSILPEFSDEISQTFNNHYIPSKKEEEDEFYYLQEVILSHKARASKSLPDNIRYLGKEESDIDAVELTIAQERKKRWPTVKVDQYNFDFQEKFNFEEIQETLEGKAWNANSCALCMLSCFYPLEAYDTFVVMEVDDNNRVSTKEFLVYRGDILKLIGEKIRTIPDEEQSETDIRVAHCYHRIMMTPIDTQEPCKMSFELFLERFAREVVESEGQQMTMGAFSREKAAQSQSHRPWDKAIESSKKGMDRALLLAGGHDALKASRLKVESTNAAMEWMEQHRYDEKPNVRIAAHILGDRYLKDTGLEGYPQRAMMKHINDYLKYRRSNYEGSLSDEELVRQQILEVSLSEDLLDLALGASMEAIACQAGKLQAMVEALQEGERCLIPSGWRSISGGHALYLEVIKEKGTYSIHIFNTGDGIQYHHSVDTPIGKQYDTCLKITEISSKKMLSEEIWKAIIELQTVATYQKFDEKIQRTCNRYAEFSSYDLYNKILGSLDGVVDDAMEEYRQPQENGVCTYEGLMTFLRHSVAPQDGARLLHDIELQTLIDFYSSHKDLHALGQDDQARLLLRYGTEKFARAFNVRCMLYPDKFSLEERQRIRTILSIIHDHTDEALKMGRWDDYKNKQIAAKPFTDDDEFPIQVEHLEQLPIIKQKQATGQILPPQNLDPIEFRNFFKNCREKTLEGHDKAAVIYSMNEFLVNLPLPKKGERSEWSSLNTVQIQECMGLIADISEYLANQDSDPIVALWVELRKDTLVSIAKAMAIQHHLAQISGTLKDYNFNQWSLPLSEIFRYQKPSPHIIRPEDIHKNSEESEDLSLYSAANRHHYEEICDYFKQNATSGDEEIFFSNKEGYVYYVNLYENDFPENLNCEGSFIHSYLSQHTDIATLDIKEQFEMVKEAFLDLTGETLPPEFCFLKRQLLIMKQLNDGKGLFDLGSTNDNVIMIQPLEGAPKLPCYNRKLLNWSYPIERTNPNIDYILANDWGFDQLYSESNDHLRMFMAIRANSISGSTAVRVNYLSKGFYPHELSISKALDFFQSHWHDLNDPMWQTACKRIFFEKDLLSKLIKKSPEYCSQICDFITMTYQRFEAENDISGAVFMLRLHQQLQDEFTQLEKENNPIVLGAIREASKANEENLNIHQCFFTLLGKAYSEEERNLICRQMVCSFSQRSQPFSSEEMDSLCVALIGYQSLSPSIADDYLDGSAKNTMIQFSELACEYVQKNSGAFVKLAKKLLEMDVEFLPSAEDKHLYVGVFQDREFQLNLGDMSLRCKNKDGFYEDVIPYTISNNEELLNLCKNTIPKKVWRVNASAFQFEDQDHLVFRVHEDSSGAIIIHKRIEEKWYQLTDFTSPSREVKRFVKNRKIDLTMRDVFSGVILGKGTRYYISIDEPSHYLIENKEGQLLYRINLTGQGNKKISSVETVGEVPLRLINFYKDLESPYQKLTDFENAIGGIHAWGDLLGNPKQLNMPRIGLQFDDVKIIEDPRAEGGQSKLWLQGRCVQEGGFILADAERQSIPALGKIKQFLVLESENDSSQLRVLIPKGWSYAEKGALSVTMTMYDHRGYYAFDLDAEGILRPLNVEGALYLADLYAKTKDYEKALYYLRSYTNKIGVYTEGELDILNVMSWQGSYEDGHPMICILQLCALAVLMKNQQEHGGINGSKIFPQFVIDTDQGGKFKENVRKLHTAYHNNRNHLASCLTAEEEYILAPMEVDSHKNGDLGEYKEPFLCKPGLKQRTLAGELHVKTGESLKSNVEGLANFGLACNEGKNVPQMDKMEMYVTKPSCTMSLEEGYRIARYGSEEERDALYIKLRIGGSSISSVSIFLSYVCRSPESFPEMDHFFKIIKNPHKYQDDIDEKIYDPIDRMKRGDVLLKNTFIESQSEQDMQYAPARFSVSPVAWQAKIPYPNFRLGIGIKFGKLSQTFGNYFTTGISHTALSEEEIKDCTEALKQEAPIDMDTLTKDLLDYHSKKDIVDYTINISQKQSNANEQDTLELMERQLITESMALKKLSLQRERDILSLVNKTTDEMVIQVRQDVAKTGTLRKDLSIDEILIMILQKNDEELKRRSPNLSHQDIDFLKQLAMDYLVQSTEYQSTKRAMNHIKEVRSAIAAYQKMGGEKEHLNDDPMFKQACQLLAKELLAPRAYKLQLDQPENNFDLLLFEFKSKLKLREDQVININRLHGDMRKEEILQMIMGSGKSKILLPILALKKADGRCLSIIVVPEAQLATTLKDMQASAGQFFEQQIQTISIDRNTSLSADKAEELLERLENICENRQCMVVTSKTLQSLSLIFQTELNKAIDRAPTPEQRRLLCAFGKILQLLKWRGDAIIDEADTIMNCKHQVQFTMTNAHSLKANRYEMSRNLYECLLGNKIISELFSPDFALQGGTTIPFEESVYHNEVKPALAESIVDFIKQKKGKDNVLGSFFLECSQGQLADIERYLLNQGQGEYIEQIHDIEIRDCLALLKEQLNELLPATLNKRCHVTYGPSGNPDVLVAIPYRSNNTPDEASRFGNPYEMINYTIQMYLQTGIPTHVIGEHVHQLQLNAAKEMFLDQSKNLLQTQAYQQFLKICNAPDGAIEIFKNPSEEAIERLTNQLNERRDGRFFDFIQTNILPSIQIYDDKVTSTPLDLVDMLRAVQGFTGTPWNKDTYHPRLHTEPAKGDDGKTIAWLYKNSRDAIKLLPENQTWTKMIDLMINEESIASGMRAHIDLGALFTGIENIKVAEEMLKKLPAEIRGVVYIDTHDNIMVLEKGNKKLFSIYECKIPPEQLFTYYDQRHTTGTDIKQSPLAQASVSIGKESTLRDVLQSVWRMRGLAASQKVNFLVPPDTQQLLRKALNLEKPDKEGGLPKITLAHIIQYAALNESKQIRTHLETSTKQFIKHTIKKAVFDEIIRQASENDIDLKAVKASLGVLFEHSEDCPSRNYGFISEEISSQEVVDSWKAQTKLELENAKKLFGPAYDEVLKGIEQSWDNGLRVDKLPGKLLANAQEKGASVEIEHVQEQEIDQEQHIDESVLVGYQHWVWSGEGIEKITKHDYSAKLNCEWIDPQFGEPIPPIISINWMTSLLFNEFSDMFSSDLLATANFLHITNDPTTKTPLFAQTQIPEPYYLIVKEHNSNRVKLIMLDHESDVPFVFKGLSNKRLSEEDDKEEEEQSVYLYNSKGRVIQHARSGLDVETGPEDEMTKLMVQAKVYHGLFTFNPTELVELERWIVQHGAERVERLIKNQIFKHHREAASHFEDSDFQKLLTKHQQIPA